MLNAIFEEKDFPDPDVLGMLFLMRFMALKNVKYMCHVMYFFLYRCSNISPE